MVVHLLSVAFTGFVFWLSVPGSNLFSWHPTCMAVAFITLVLQAIVIFSPESSLFQSSPRTDKVQLHWILHAFGLASAAFGFFAVYVNKEVNGRAHFTSWHGKMGLVTFGGAFGVALGGLCAKYGQSLRRFIRPASLKLYHATGGMLIFVCAMSTVCLACYSNWFRNRVESPWLWRVAFWSPIVLAVCVARQVTQNYLPKVLTQHESQLDAKARNIKEKVDEKLKKQAEKKKSGAAARKESESSAAARDSEHEKAD